MPTLLNNIVITLNKHRNSEPLKENQLKAWKSRLHPKDKEKYAATFCFSKMDKALESGMGWIAEIFDGFAEVKLLAPPKDKKAEWAMQYEAIISKIQPAEIEGMQLKPDSISATRLERLYSEMISYAADEMLKPNGEPKDSIYKALKMDELIQKAKASEQALELGLSEEEQKQRNNRVQELSDKKTLGNMLVSACYLYPLSSFMTKVTSSEESNMALRYMEQIRQQKHTNIMEKWLQRKQLPKPLQSMDNQIKKQLIKLENDKEKTPSGPKKNEIEMKISYLKAAQTLLNEYTQEYTQKKTSAGPVFLGQLRALDYDLRAASDTNTYKKMFHIAPSETARLITSLCKQLEKYDPECKKAKHEKKDEPRSKFGSQGGL